MKLETRAIHAGHAVDPASGAIVAPVHFSTTYERAPDGSYPLEYVYSRLGNPNRLALEARITALEGGTAALSFASGSAAIYSLLQTLAQGDHVVAPDVLYYGIRIIMTDIMARQGISTTFVDMSCPANVAAALRPETRLVLLETPSNPELGVCDIRAIADLAHDAGAQVACDNTIATPVFQQPLQPGADYVLHATTKYLGGHSDVLGGVVVAREVDERFERLQQIQQVGGAVPSPLECWLTLRGIETLPLRVRAHADNALQVARFLEQHPAVERVNYPGLAGHPAHDVARRQMSGYGGLLSFQLRGDAAAALALTGRVKLFRRATSFGGTHSLIEHRASMEKGVTMTAPNLLRVSVGLEHADDLIADLDQALRD